MLLAHARPITMKYLFIYDHTCLQLYPSKFERGYNLLHFSLKFGIFSLLVALLFSKCINQIFCAMIALLEENLAYPLTKEYSNQQS